MRLVAVLVAVAALVLAAVASNAATPVFRYGVAAGEVTSTSAILWTRAPASGNARLVVRLGSEVVAARVLQASAASDLTVQSRVTGLRPGRRYTYLFTHGARASETGAFTTAPAPTADRRVRFAISGDADATPGQTARRRSTASRSTRAWPRSETTSTSISATRSTRTAVGAGPPARTRAEKWEKYRLGLALPRLRRLRASTGLYSHWDDHEFVNDFSRSEHGGAIYAAGVQAFRDYSPAAY